MTLNRIKILATVLFVLPLIALTAFQGSRAAAVTSMPDDDTAAVFKTKCAMCHGQKAEKAYNPDMPQAEQIDAVMKGKKAEKPPNMPAFEPKGMTADQAKALVEFMQGLRKPAQ